MFNKIIEQQKKSKTKQNHKMCATFFLGGELNFWLAENPEASGSMIQQNRRKTVGKPQETSICSIKALKHVSKTKQNHKICANI